MANASPAAAAREPLDRRDATNLALIAASYLLLIGATLDWHGYWYDEFYTIRAVDRSWPEMIRERAAQGHPPLLTSDRAAFLALQWFFAWALVAAAGGWGIGIVSVERYFAPALVCQAGLVALTWTAAVRTRKRLAGALVAAMLAVTLLSAAMYAAMPLFTPWREMATLILEQRSPGEAVIVASPAVLVTPFAYYYDGQASYSGDAALVHPARGAAGIWGLLSRGRSAGQVANGRTGVAAGFRLPRPAFVLSRRGLAFQQASGFVGRCGWSEQFAAAVACGV